MTNGHPLSRTIAILAIAAPVTVGATLLAQTTARPAFEVASVKPNKSGDRGMGFGMQPGGRFTVTNAPLKEMIRFAFGLQNFRIVGGPDWIGSERFDVSAKAEGDPMPSPPGGPPGPLLQMLQTLLAERFALKTHTETREMPIYALMLARSDGKPGPGLRPAAVDCAALFAAARARGGPPPAPPAPGQPMPCGMRIGPGLVSAGSMGMAQFASSLAQMVGRIIVDKTGLTQNLDFELKWTPEGMPQRPAGAPVDQPVRLNGVDIDSNGPSIFTALQEQLGLKLDSQKGPVEVLVIDSVDRPTPD